MKTKLDVLGVGSFVITGLLIVGLAVGLLFLFPPPSVVQEEEANAIRGVIERLIQEIAIRDSVIESQGQMLDRLRSSTNCS